MSSNPLEDLFKTRKEHKEKQDIQKQTENDVRRKCIEEAINVLMPVCSSIYTFTIDAVKYANSQLNNSKLHVLCHNIKTEIDDLYLDNGSIFVVAANIGATTPSLNNMEKYPTLEFKADVSLKSIKIFLLRSNDFKVIREYNSLDIDIKNLVYSEIACFLANNRIA